MASIRIPPVLRPLTDDQSRVDAVGETLGAALDHLFARYPKLRSRLLDDAGELQRFINVYVNDEDVRSQAGFETPVGEDASIIILPAMAGGAGTQVARTSISGSVLDAIGNTPLVDISSVLEDAEQVRDVRLLAKLECQNPTGSVKDRVALSMVRAARDSGALAAGQTILEPTSGNTGISLALIGSLMGHPVRVVMPDNATPERLQMLALYGAEVIESPGDEGSNGAVRLAQKLAAEDDSLFMPMQYENPANPDAHYNGTALELLEQTDGAIDTFVAGLGTGGTLMGVGRRLREHNPDVKIIAAEPLPTEFVMGLRSLDHGYIPPILDTDLLDRRILVDNISSVVGTRALARAGIFAGVSAGAVLHVARRVAADADDGETIVMLVADSGWKYMSANVWGRDLDSLEAHMETGHWW
jgi:cysteine synthase B